MWESSRDAARQAEDRTRREAGRDIGESDCPLLWRRSVADLVVN